SDDISMMKEVLTRRLKTDWPQPDLIVLDGGLPQLSAIRNSSFVIRCPVIALAKKGETIYFLDAPPLKLPHSHPGLQLLMRVRDAAHRFSRRLHHKHRNKSLLLAPLS
ncbi:excinuclease ABC subunit UvrC, partial [Candidatus Amesbacteria bacterium]|nr:excinuclease ABC subunit UvrC [Candidatus Amesbacteria bacterium]